ncbi:kelch repeat-containing protein [Cytophagaceae bacterium DM2B3-1]|uniref:Kelch repeat-containing protein n=1 Tax=Xanthocytophaga flava TaxID=3048013 RepID=A0ABT7CJZ3_9BACT|nr:kelch repeat-containing protein [Xanthocytophaga flavus]MDJ1467757.1 kelch repeat-containing protein [Xanthocytophaga flavus]MDJ1493836.1 kelch repeat-containing protein [Xanthocytophaga flavus]
MNHKRNLLVADEAGFARKIAFSLVLFVSAFVLSSCGGDSTDPADGNWYQIESGYNGVARYGAVSFMIGNNVYSGLGIDKEGDRLSDFYIYNAANGYWDSVKVASFPGVPRTGAVAFSAGGFGYVGLGYNNDTEGDYLADFYKYDPTKNTWTKIKDFPSGRQFAVAFVVNNVAYVGTGINDNYLQDFYKYDAVNNEWLPIRTFGGSKRYGATAFTINGKGYVGLGINNAVPQKNIYEYDPEQNTWTKKDQLTDEGDFSARSQAGVFILNNKAYIFMGTSGSAQLGDIWEYEPTADVWNQKQKITDDCGSGRSFPLAFSYDNKGYIMTGASSASSGSALDDMWQFTPDVVKVDCADE